MRLNPRTFNFRRSLLLFAATFAVLSTPATAGYVIQATVIKLRATEYPVTFVFVDKPIVNRAACATSATENFFAIDTNAPAGRALVNALLTAQITKAKVTIVGRGHYPASFAGSLQCHVWGDTESVNYIDVE